jgi:hypothetical protein
LSSCSSSSAAACALDKRTYRKIAEHIDYTAPAAAAGGTGRRRLQESATAGESNSTLLPAPSKWKTRGAGCRADTDSDSGTGAATTAAADLRPLETVAELSRTLVGFTTADLVAEILKEMEEVERIASVSSNMKVRLVRRLRLASWRVRASSAELRQRTIATFAVASTVADLYRLCIHNGGLGVDDMRMEDSVKTETTDKDGGPNSGQEHEGGAYLRERVRSLESEVGLLQETVERPSERCTKGIRQAEGTTTTRGAKGNAPEAPTGVIMGPPPSPAPHSRSASRLLCCSDRAGSDEMAVGKGPKGLGGPGPRDPLDGLKALFLFKLEGWWREIAHRNAIPPATDTAAVAETVPPRLQPARGTSRSTVESSGDETEAFVVVAGRGRGGTWQKGRRPEAQPLPTVHAPTRDARVMARTSSSLPLSSWQTGISAYGTVDCNKNHKGPKARTFAKVVARPSALRSTEKESAGAGS